MNATQQEASLALTGYFRERRTCEFYMQGDTDMNWSLRGTRNQSIFITVSGAASKEIALEKRTY